MIGVASALCENAMIKFHPRLLQTCRRVSSPWLLNQPSLLVGLPIDTVTLNAVAVYCSGCHIDRSGMTNADAQPQAERKSGRSFSLPEVQPGGKRLSTSRFAIKFRDAVRRASGLTERSLRAEDLLRAASAMKHIQKEEAHLAGGQLVYNALVRVQNDAHAYRLRVSGTLIVLGTVLFGGTQIAALATTFSGNRVTWATTTYLVCGQVGVFLMLLSVLPGARRLSFIAAVLSVCLCVFIGGRTSRDMRARRTHTSPPVPALTLEEPPHPHTPHPTPHLPGALRTPTHVRRMPEPPTATLPDHDSQLA